jgi:hypothetical protein
MNCDKILSMHGTVPGITVVISPGDLEQNPT